MWRQTQASKHPQNEVKFHPFAKPQMKFSHALPLTGLSDWMKPIRHCTPLQTNALLCQAGGAINSTACMLPNNLKGVAALAR